MNTPNKRKQLKKHAAAVHSGGELTLIQRKICNALLYKAFPSLLLTEIHEISTRELIDLIGFSGNNHAVLKKSFKALIGAVFEWNLLGDEGEEDWTASGLLASARVSGSRCFYSYSAHLRELLHMPRVYASIDILTQSRFRSVYGLVLYENCVRYRNIKHTKWMTIDLFRKLMGVHDSKYTIFRDLKRRVIDVAVEEVNTYSDIRIEPEYEKCGRSISKIRFHLYVSPALLVEKNASSQPLETDTAYNEPLISKLVEKLGMSREVAIKQCSAYAEETILEKLELVCGSVSFQKGDILNLPAYFISALKNDFKNAKSNASLLAEQQQAARQVDEEKARQSKQLQARHKEYETYTANLLKEKLSKIDIAPLISVFAQQIQKNADEVMLSAYEKKGLESPMVWVMFKKFLLAHSPCFFEDIKSFDDFFVTETANDLGVKV